MRDKETEGHSRRVTQLAVEFARKMNFPEEEIVHIRRGALLHDIGKLGISDAILNKPDLLTKEERKIIQEHPNFAYKMLQSIPYLRPALDIPHLHHEMWNGEGYPNGLSGENIPKSARMFAVIDVFEALTSDRSYRKAWKSQDAIEYIKEQSGKHFDPEVVKMFIEFLDETPSLKQT
jgi:putative nucleotidyltransferase with HDIG domain